MTSSSSSSSSSLNRHRRSQPPVLPTSRSYTQAFSDPDLSDQHFQAISSHQGQNHAFCQQIDHQVPPSGASTSSSTPAITRFHSQPSYHQVSDTDLDSAQMAAYSITQLASQQQSQCQIPMHQQQPQESQQSPEHSLSPGTNPKRRQPVVRKQTIKDDKRAEQNREAQRTFRLKRDNYIKELEIQSKELQTIRRISGLEIDPSRFGPHYRELLQQVEDLRNENHLLKNHLLNHLGHLPNGISLANHDHAAQVRTGAQNGNGT